MYITTFKGGQPSRLIGRAWFVRPMTARANGLMLRLWP